MKTIEVVAAIICDNMKKPKKIYTTQRGYGDLVGGWEFPGGKIEEGETPEVALEREIMEELDTKIKVGKLLEVIDYDYPNFHLHMYCYLAEVVEGELVLKEHQAGKWITKDKIFEVAWLPADVLLLGKLCELMGTPYIDCENDGMVWELCGKCGAEVHIPNNRRSKCPECGEEILPCSMCVECSLKGEECKRY